MSEPIANQEEQSGTPPSTQQAANDLREAAGEKTRQIAQSAEERAQLLKESAAQKAQHFREYAGEKASQIADVAGEKAAQFKDAAGEHWEETRVKAREVHADLEDYIRQHPTKSVLVAAGVGFLLGLIVRR
ncbi:MAG: hypothetical protein CMN05_03395 [Roseibacillus sp.]|jgi:ElaB/YqjD/DUF883 family membrane-anchored ribosome-binding protein|nr:hypothetical protein [Roseibacillus sp.]MBP34835.1 hypothetical protein [Roseibacillus sp.]MBP34967.1 hypothetical protein [Roseibacillus sp.]MCP4730314.1 DUF883 family protein [Roseibacillus sp.]MDP7105600.1 hypothetical protein [Roseibacillus sp.]|tara:strand:+ start:22705 stop:23097 length:393 start_codon:yes stop_codon:yes gene_type:complete